VLALSAALFLAVACGAVALVSPGQPGSLWKITVQANWSGYTEVAVTTIYGGDPVSDTRRISYYKTQTFDPWAYGFSPRKPFHVSISAVPVDASAPVDRSHHMDCQVLIEWQQPVGADKLKPIVAVDGDTRPGRPPHVGCGTSITRIPPLSRNGD
jgi:hypothetical protein